MEENKTKKLSYEELEAALSQYTAANNQLQKMVYERDLTNVFQRLNFLFKVVENNDAFSQEFVSKCIAEIEATMTIPEDNKEESKKD